MIIDFETGYRYQIKQITPELKLQLVLLGLRLLSGFFNTCHSTLLFSDYLIITSKKNRFLSGVYRKIEGTEK